MSTSEISVPRASVKPYLPPWKVVARNDHQLNEMYKDWGIHHARKERFNTARECFNKALDIYPNDVNTLRRRSQSKRMQALASEALIDAQKAQGLADYLI